MGEQLFAPNYNNTILSVNGSGSTPANPSLFSSSENASGPFFIVATAIFMVAFFYMLTFLFILRFGTFVPVYNARFFRGRIYFCYQQSLCFGFLGTCDWCFVPLCCYFLLNPVREDENFNRAQEGGGLSREDRREALQELLKHMVTIVHRSDREFRTPTVAAEANDLPLEGPCGETYHESLIGGEDGVTFNPTNEGRDCSPASPVNACEVTATNEYVEDLYFEPMDEGEERSLKAGYIEYDENAVTADFVTRPENESSLSPVASFIITDEDLEMTDPKEDNDESIVSSSVYSLGFDPLCSICLCEYENGSSIIKTDVCGHRFHEDCLLEWLEVQNNTKCPCCRKNIITNQQVKETSRMLRKKSRRTFGVLLSWFDRKNNGRAIAGERDDYVSHEGVIRTRTSDASDDLVEEGDDVSRAIIVVGTTNVADEGIGTTIAPVSVTMTRDLEVGRSD